MSGIPNRRGWGWIRKLPSGRYHASYVGVDRIRHNAPNTFEFKVDAEAWLDRQERRAKVDRTRGHSKNPCAIAGCRRVGGGRRLCDKHENTMRWAIVSDLGIPIRGVSVSQDGYVCLYELKPNRRQTHHKLVMERMLGRKLYPGENVHHRNGNRLDNRPENLELWVRSQPAGQRPADLVVWAREILARYADMNPNDIDRREAG